MQTDNDLYIAVTVLNGVLEAALATLPTPMTTANIKYPNAPDVDRANTPWLRISYVGNGPIQTDLAAGNQYQNSSAFYDVGVFWPRGSGDKACMDQAKAIANLYNAEIFDDLRVNNVIVSPQTQEPSDSNWFGVNVGLQISYEGRTF